MVPVLPVVKEYGRKKTSSSDDDPDLSDSNIRPHEIVTGTLQIQNDHNNTSEWGATTHVSCTLCILLKNLILGMWRMIFPWDPLWNNMFFIYICMYSKYKQIFCA